SSQKEEKEKSEFQMQALEDEFKSYEDEFNTVLSKLNNINLELERLYGEKKNTENAISRAESSIETINKSIEKRKTDIESSTEEELTLQNVTEEKRIEFDDLQNLKTVLENEEAEIDAKYKSIRAQITEIETR